MPPPPSPPPPRRLPSLETTLVALELVALAAGRTTVSPAFRPLRTIVELLPARPVTTRWRTCLPPRTTVTVSAEIALVGTLMPSACLTTTSAVALIPSFRPAFHLVELEGHVIAHHAAAARREQRHFADVGCQLAAVEGFDGDGRDLACFDVADFRFAQRHHELHRAEVAEHRERGARGARGGGAEELDAALAERPLARRGPAARRCASGAAGGAARAGRPASCRCPRRLLRPGRRARRSCRSRARRAWCPGRPVRRFAPSACRS